MIQLSSFVAGVGTWQWLWYLQCLTGGQYTDRVAHCIWLYSHAVTHVVSDHDSVESTLSALEKVSVPTATFCTVQHQLQHVTVVTSAWLSQCIKQGTIIPVSSEHLVPHNKAVCLTLFFPTYCHWLWVQIMFSRKTFKCILLFMLTLILWHLSKGC